jgi:zona occludens toxin
MAINILLGVPGDGKTYTAVSKWALKTVLEEKRKIKTNIPMNIDYWKEKHPDSNIDELIEIKQGESGNAYDAFQTVADFEDEWINGKGQRPLVIVDEAHFCLSNNRKKSDLKPIQEFFALHRQAGYDILLLTQTTNGFDRTILGIVDHFYHCRKLSAVGYNNKYKLTLKKTGNKNTSTDIIQEQVFSFKPEIFPYYKSHALSDGEVEEAIDTNVKSFLRHPIFYAIFCIPFFFLFLYFKGWLNFNIFSSSSKTAENTKNLERSQSSNIVSNTKSVSSQEIVQKNKMIQSLNGELQELKNQNKDLAKSLEKIQGHPFTSSNIIIKASTWKPSNQSKFVFSAIVEGPNGIFSTNSKSLKKIGYEIEFIDSCLYRWNFKEFNGYWTCGSSKDQKRLSENMKL